MKLGAESNFLDYARIEAEFRAELAEREKNKKDNIARRVEIDQETEKYHDNLKKIALNNIQELYDIEQFRGFRVEYQYLLHHKDNEGYQLRPEIGIATGIISNDLLELLGEMFEEHYLAGAVEFKARFIFSDKPAIFSYNDFEQITEMRRFKFGMSDWGGRIIDAEVDGERHTGPLSRFVYRLNQKRESGQAIGDIKVYLLGWEEHERDTLYDLTRKSHYEDYEDSESRL